VFPLGVFSLAADELWRRAPDLMPLRVVSAILMCAWLQPASQQPQALPQPLLLQAGLMPRLRSLTVA
jgi:hypothetical protein